jgi:hypothetical protein
VEQLIVGGLKVMLPAPVAAVAVAVGTIVACPEAFGPPELAAVDVLPAPVPLAVVPPLLEVASKTPPSTRPITRIPITTMTAYIMPLERGGWP